MKTVLQLIVLAAVAQVQTHTTQLNLSLVRVDTGMHLVTPTRTPRQTYPKVIEKTYGSEEIDFTHIIDSYFNPDYHFRSISAISKDYQYDPTTKTNTNPSNEFPTRVFPKVTSKPAAGYSGFVERKTERPTVSITSNDYPLVPLPSPGLARPAVTILPVTPADYKPATAYTSIDYPHVPPIVGAPINTYAHDGLKPPYIIIDYPDLQNTKFTNSQVNGPPYFR